MKARELGSGTARTFVLVFDADDEVVNGILSWARHAGVSAASFTGLGAFRSATLGYFDLDRRDYDRIQVDEQVELLSLIGNIALAGDELKVHAHVVVGRRDGAALGGHLLEARVRPTLEMVVTEAAAPLRRRMDPETGLPLLDPEAG